MTATALKEVALSAEHQLYCRSHSPPQSGQLPHHTLPKKRSATSLEKTVCYSTHPPRFLKGLHNLWFPLIGGEYLYFY
uniref:Uncharacterized protein n=1 Tax=Anguilla anguilla TaxID=7936 RepID=A0A0E9PP14_ANGAN